MYVFVVFNILCSVLNCVEIIFFFVVAKLLEDIHSKGYVLCTLQPGI